jgi:predicted O-methyltransferase YrrM
MDDPRWSKVDDYFSSVLLPEDAALTAALAANDKAGLPAIDVSPLLGKFLHILARAMSATQVLEIGTLGGYSTIWLARALPAGGRVVTLEANAVHAAVARVNLERAGVSDRVELRLGLAIDSLAQLIAQRRGPFDLIFIDADKASNADYLRRALELSRPGTLIVCDNVVRRGAVVDAASADPDIQGTRAFFELLAKEPRLSASALQTVGVKGYDGFAIAIVN